MRIGHGYDVHRLVDGRKLILGGVEIPFEKGLDGHSDADVLTHAVMDALLGAAALGDIGKRFPDNDVRYLGADSIELSENRLRRSDGTWMAARQPRCDRHRPAAEARTLYRRDARPHRRRARRRRLRRQRQGHHGRTPWLHRRRLWHRGPRCLPDRAIMSGAARSAGMVLGTRPARRAASFRGASGRHAHAPARQPQRALRQHRLANHMPRCASENAAANARPPDERLLAGRHADGAAL